MGIPREPLAQVLEGLVVLSVVVELMRAFVVVVGAEERFRHRTGLPGRLCYDKKRRPVTQATCVRYLAADERTARAAPGRLDHVAAWVCRRGGARRPQARRRPGRRATRQ